MNEDVITGSIEAIQEAFRRVGPMILAGAGKADSIEKSDGTPVTDIDVAAEKEIKSYLLKRHPNLAVVGEESGYENNALPPTVWLIDPIDGTRSYISNIPSFTCMATLIHNNRAEAAVIYNPSTHDMYVARHGQGAYKNGQRLDLSRVPLPNVLYCKQQFIEALNDMLVATGVHAEPAPTGAGYAYAQVADGVSAARFQLHAGGYLHDYAPGGLLVHEAGGDVIPILEDAYTYRTRSFVVCHPALSSTIRAHLSELRGLEDPNNTAL